MKKVLLLTTYPILHPRHGGQVRAANVAKVFSDCGWHVTSLAVYEPEGYAPATLGPLDVEFSPGSRYRKFKGLDIPLINDLLVGDFAAADDGGFSEIRKKLPLQLDAIHVEQPWLWPLALRLKGFPEYANVCLIYGSQNIEAPLKKEILESYGVGNVTPVIEAIDALERNAARTADVTVAVTQTDLEVIRSWGVGNCVLAPNGIAPWQATEELKKKWGFKLPDAPWILYVASAHPPNFKGFNECLGNSLACIPPDSRLVVAGSVCEHLARELSESRWSSLNLSRLELLYILSDEDLAAVKSLAHAFLLPIPHGGGSNIKTAEAIYSGKYVIGSESAFRGFESHLTLPEVKMATTPFDFHRLIREALSELPPVSDYRDFSDGRETLTWSNSLREIPDATSAIIEGFTNK
jgi:glycosyltransferase involved in cell wall biosynthesis